MADAQARDGIVVDVAAVEAYVREAKATVVAGATYVAVLGAFVLLRIFLDVPYLRAALGLYVVVSVVVVLLKRRIHGLPLPRLVASAAVGLGVNALVLLTLVERNRGTLFAEAAALLVAVTANHVLDRVAARRA